MSGRIAGSGRLRGQFSAGLLCHHVLGVPARPVRVPLANARLMRAVCGLRATKGARQIACRGERGRVRVDPSRESCGDLLQQPAIAVGVVEDRVRTVAPIVRRGTAYRAAERSGPLSEMEYLTDLDTALQQVVARSLDVGNNQEHPLGGSRCALAGLAKVNRALGSRRRELDCALIAVAEVGVEPPPETFIELFRAVNVRHRDGNHFEL